MTEPGSPSTDRADKMLVALGHFGSRAAAQAAIAAGLVFADGKVIAKPSETLSRDASIQSEAAHPYVSRGGLKLAGALDVFSVDPAGLACLDLGASTGGFTDVLLRAGAAHVTCVDVGRGQLHAKIADDPRVTSFERLNARDLSTDHLTTPPQLIVCDLSFVSLAKVLDVPLSLAAPAATIIALFKPQFEVGPSNVGRGGLVTDDAATETALGAFLNYLIQAGWRVEAPQPSPIPGGDGNREWLVCARRPGV
jgi:23S rRNA (cytidine1920-2'-O)/16S rRNA (cytidine1409-2'-O)-methyltransferase